MSIDQRGPVINGALLRAELIRLRKTSKMTQEEVAKRLDWHTSKLIRIEGGRTGISKVDLEALVRLYGAAGGQELDRLIELNQGARSRAWWDEFKNDVTEAYLTYIGFEAGASRIRQFQPLAIPGLLQTKEYAETITTDPDVVRLGQRVRLRLRRQDWLNKRQSPPQQKFILDEAVIRRHVGISKDPAIMPSQLRHIVDIVRERDNVEVRVIPFNVGAHAGMLRGAFTLLDFQDELGELLHMESSAAEITLTGDDPRIADARADFEALTEEALAPGESLDLIIDVASQMG
ncbi:helix-turn-helix domain-containing protein [Microbispora rosea]|uniref:helix-turn-helix domain-containing protein n=1 Tax=Microbispora rosea TaxID=58117 RepID=UPI0009708675|nr:helix-turn-helix transcriptional regulator [Microbispora rosea]